MMQGATGGRGSFESTLMQARLICTRRHGDDALSLEQQGICGKGGRMEGI
jgi:hypothetical protein